MLAPFLVAAVVISIIMFFSVLLLMNNRMSPHLAQEQRPPEGDKPNVPRMPQGIVLPGSVKGAPKGKGKVKGDTGLQERAVQASVQVRG